ncbi:hypothetical protein DRE_04868 [Drechslerella stenobrocha 248]|uniref:VPS4-associated protein 1 n=1 Tax=Drechslerella stenobrocha 248 TaxID=1043628 RepID=W7HP39_9PEZI|nr:hypothetical protein DRE_04868 [Drechslerella stenobrocha 248]
MALPFQNVYIHRKVGEPSSKPCMVCFKSSTSVLITSCQKGRSAQDFFYICPAHLTDKGFATALLDEAAEQERKKKEEMDKELEKIKKEYDEKMKLKEEKKKNKGKEKSGSAKDEEVEKIKTEEAKAASPVTDAEAAVASFSEYQLHRDFFNIRQRKYLEKQLAKRNMERLKNPLSFPAVPKGDPL